MNCKYYLPALCLFLAILSCKNESSGEGYDPVHNIDIEHSPTESGITKLPPEDSAPANSSKMKEAPKVATPVSLEGNYIKSGREKDASCDCYCIEVNLATPFEVCIREKEIYIVTRLQRSQDNILHMYLVEPSAKNTGGKDIPWDKFDRDQPIATLIQNNTGELELDWLGFTINGDLAIDYAVYGKKTLEGNYTKK